MDLDNIQQNMNTRVVFKEPRGMVRWIQLFFAIIAFSTVVDYYSTLGVTIFCPPNQPPSSSTTASPSNTSQSPSIQPPTQAQVVQAKLIISYPFDFSNQVVKNPCPGVNASYTQVSKLTSSPQFFVTTGVLSLLYGSASLACYLLFSSTYESIPIFPVADLIISGILALFWFIASSSFSSGVSLLKSSVNYETMSQALCQSAGVSCVLADQPSWRSLNVALVSGFTSFFLWAAGMWFIFKETHFHQPRDQFGP